MKKLFESIKNGLHEVGSSLNLSFDDDSVADEKIPFLVYLAQFLKDDRPNPCEPPAGCLNFRNIVAEFMKSYHHIPLTPEVRLCVYFIYNYVCLYCKFAISSYWVLLPSASYDTFFFSFLGRMI